EFRLAVEEAVRPFRNDPDVAAVYTWGSTSSDTLNTTFISADRTQSLAILVMAHTATPGASSLEDIRSRLASDTLEIQIGGWPATAEAFLGLAGSDLARAEIISLPITLILLLVIFGSVIAAGLPIILALLSMIATLAALALLSRVMLVNIFSINAVTMLGLAVGIDYALIMVSRFREETTSTAISESIPRIVDTAGRAVLIAGSTVAIGLTGLLIFGVPAAISTGLAGAFVVLTCVALALTALPASFVLWGHRISRRNINFARYPRFLTLVPNQVQALRKRYPFPVVIVCGLLLMSLALPLRQLVVSSPTMTILPRTSEPRIVYDTIAESFPNATLSPISIIVEPQSGTMMSAPNLAAVRTLTTNLGDTPGVSSAESVWEFIPDSISVETFTTSLLIEPEMVRAAAPLLTSDAALINLTPDPGLDAAQRRDLVEDLRAAMPSLTESSLTVRIGGDAGLDLDLMNHVKQRAPLVVGFVIGLTWLALLVQFRSLFLPLKAILLNLISLSASFGALVWIFQEGHLSNVLAFEPLGYTVVLVPILMFCFLFGLSMDFEVLMLSRIREAWEETGDNSRAIDLGLHRSAGIVTSSALVMLVVFSAFGTSQLQLVKSLGVGLGLAVFIDATIIRMLLLPATMQLMGRWNWWLPFASERKSGHSERQPLVHEHRASSS
ncbi:MAG TPA: MMPL family transporter, partial [Thermomicrobiales bacterium]|nr:MMPL family transporter [Thermomicrobiales bacterium]